MSLGPQTSTIEGICSPCYDYAIVSDGLEASLFVLARNVTQFNEVYDAKVLQELKTLGKGSLAGKTLLLTIAKASLSFTTSLKRLLNLPIAFIK